MGVLATVVDRRTLLWLPWHIDDSEAVALAFREEIERRIAAGEILSATDVKNPAARELRSGAEKY